MRVFKTKWFNKVAKSHAIKDSELYEAIEAVIKSKERVEICMTAKNKSKSPAFEAIHSAASGLFSVDAIPQETMRNFDKACLNSVDDLQPIEIKALREKLNVSQPVFARYLNTSVSTVQKWESGVKRPSGLSLKLLTVVRKHGLKV